MNTPEQQRAQATEAEINAQDPIAGRPAGPPDPQDVSLGFETSDINLGGVVRALIGLGVFTAIVFGVVSGFQAFLTGELGSFTPIVANAPRNPVPEIIESRAATGVEYRELRALEEEQLSTYGWVDEGAGVTHIPIERAMELLVERGLPSRPEDEASDSYEMPQDSSSGRTLERNVP